METQELFAWVRVNEVAGIPADILAHFIIGGIIGFVVFLLVGSDKRAMIVVSVAALVKELVFDINGLINTGNFFEPTKDIVISIIGGALVLFLAGRPFKMNFGQRGGFKSK